MSGDRSMETLPWDSPRQRHITGAHTKGNHGQAQSQAQPLGSSVVSLE